MAGIRRQFVTAKLKPTPRPPLMSHEERQALIRQPFRCELPGGCCERLTTVPGRSWAGSRVGMESWHHSCGVDDSSLRYGAGDDPRQGEL